MDQSDDKWPASRLLAFARELQQAASFKDLLEITRREVSRTTGYGHAWLFVADSPDARELRLIDVAGARDELVWKVAPVLRVDSDAMLQQIVASDEPVVVVDARVDPRTDKQIVAALGNRTIINIPLRLLDKPFGAFGVGSFGDEEGCRAPTGEQLDYLIGMASQLSVAASRIRLLEERALQRAEAQALEHRLQQVQRLESLGLLAGGVAHDFNNLLSVVLAGAELAREYLAVDPQRASAELDAIVEAAESARVLTQQLLAMGRKQELTVSALDLDASVTRLVDLLRRVLPRSIEVELRSTGEALGLEADAARIDQVLMNLCLNARDAMPGGGRLTIATAAMDIGPADLATHPWAKPGRYAVVTVTDTGTGMTPEVVERAFEPFFTTKPGTAGTGLGLSVAYGIVRQHGGMTACSSELGRGTTFTVFLPVARSSSVAGANPPAGLPSTGGANPSTHSRSALPPPRLC
ncbi:MAG: GAF domain-containing protein [Myxococcales bacterium]|nr:GAF domain-containing protein [Myxococcales bacterium]